LRIAGILTLLVAGTVALACPTARAAQAPVLVVGDSLAVGMRPFLGSMLPDREVVWDARTGRTTPQGLARLRADLPQVTPTTVVVSLGTNDGSDPGRFANRMRRLLLALPPTACVVWPAIYRPPRKGPYEALNRVLRRQARSDPRFVVPRWDVAVLRGEVQLPDGLHPDEFGFRHRSRIVASAIDHHCASGA
jgi:GDSL-like lipase/acylhydrolase family protein